MNIIDYLKKPYENDPHKIYKTICFNKWNDRFNVKYSFINNCLIVDNIRYIKTLLNHFKFIPFDIKIVFKINNQDRLDRLINELNINNTNKNIILDLSNYDDKDDNFNINKFLLLPNNVQITFNGYSNGFEDKDIKNNKFNNMFLWLDDFDRQNIYSKLDNETMNSLFNLRNLVYNFYCHNSDYLDNSSVIEKSNYIYEYINNNYNNINICCDKAILFKLFLNNKYININSFVVNSNLFGKSHNFNLVYDENNRPYCYDLDNNLKQYNSSLVNIGYSILNFSDVKMRKNRNKVKKL